MISWAPPAQAVKRRGESSPGWLYHHLTIIGPAGTMDEITAAARGNLVLGQGKFSGHISGDFSGVAGVVRSGSWHAWSSSSRIVALSL